MPTNYTRFRGVPLAALATASLLACSTHRDEEPRGDAGAIVHMGSATAGPGSLRAGDVRIVATNDGVDLALIGDTISTGLSPQALAKARAETDTTKVSGSGFGASIEKMVKGTVASAIGTRMAFPLSAVRDVRYESGAIRFEWAGKPVGIFDQTKINGRPLLESFRPDDAQRFVDAVKARKRRSQNPM